MAGPGWLRVVSRRTAAVVASLLLFTSDSRASAPPVLPPVVRLRPAFQERVDDIVLQAIRKREFPGAVVVIGRSDGVWFRRAYGSSTLQPAKTPMATDTVFDLASLTKAVATTPAILCLAAQQRIALDDPVAKHLPEFALNGKAAITIRQLLTHTSGLPDDNPLADYRSGANAAVNKVLGLQLVSPPGSRLRYSDVGFIVLGELVARTSGKPLADFVRDEVLVPLAMTETGFTPDAALRARSAPTTQERDSWLRGEVHDPRARAMGGVAGHAGLFSTADDLVRFASMVLSAGVLDGQRVLPPDAVSLMLTPLEDSHGERTMGLAVRRDAAATWIGHEGFTGTALWMSPRDDIFLIVLSSRLHPDGNGDMHPTVRALRGIALEAVRGSPAASAPRPDRPVLAGVDVLLRDDFRALQDARVALITNAGARTRDGNRTSELLAAAPGVHVVALLAPEHGLEARLEGNVPPSVDLRTGLPIRSLYGVRRDIDPQSLGRIDAVVFDLQDAGTRFYTYLSTMLLAMKSAARSNLRFVVLDRPNPLGGELVEGPTTDRQNLSFVNHARIPIRHGLTAGELATLLNRELALGARLEVVRMEGWQRSFDYQHTGLSWFAPSPNLRSPEEALLYAGVGMLERTNVSVGRGTETPFELIGAPWMDNRLQAALQESGLAGVTFTRARFTPTASTHAGRPCEGVRLTVTDPAVFRPVRTALSIAMTLKRLYPKKWQSARLHELLGNDEVFELLESGATIEEMSTRLEADEGEFRARRAWALLY